MTTPTPDTGDYVILLHGIARTRKSMAKMAGEFAAEGYQVLNLDYPSRKHTISEIADIIHADIEKFATDKTKKIHFIGYSMGGLVARAYIHRHPPENMGRLVMLGSPNQGSEVADMLRGTFAFDKFYGPAGEELTTAFDRAAVMGTPSCEVGVVAGTWTIDPISYFIIRGPNDGKVSVESTKIEGMKEHVIMPVTHTFMPANTKVIAAAKSFVKNGRF